MLTDMRTGFEIEMENAQSYADRALTPRRVSVATGHASYEHIRSICKSLCERFEGLCVDVYPITNFFFGEQITVSGLLTGKDISEQLAGRELGDELLFPSVCLRAEGDVFLDDMTPEELSQRLGVRVTPTGSEASEFIEAVLGIK